MTADLVAVVTGASRGIGRALALELGRRGVTVVVTSRTVEPHRRLPGSIVQTCEEIVAAGGKAVMVQADLTDPDAAAKIIDRATELTGRVDILVNSAADTSTRWGSLAEVSREDWEREYAVNVHAPFSLIKAVVPVMEGGRGGVIVNLTSGTGDLTPPETHDSTDSATIGSGVRLAYASSKAALNRLGNALAPELRAKSIAVVTVDPGLVRTELTNMLIERGRIKDIAAPSPAQIATAIADLALTGTAMEHTGQIIRLQP